MKSFSHYLELLRLSAAASLLIGLGNFVLLKVGEPIGPFLFAFGLLGVCVLGLSLFTGKCGFLIEDKIKIRDILAILIGNLVFGYLIGAIFNLADPSIVPTAEAKVESWAFTLGFFIKSALCGVIMYLAVELYRRNTKLGILLGVPLFIFCGFQHSIANAITMGVSLSFSPTILLCVAGNFIGALAAWTLCHKKREPRMNKQKFIAELEKLNLPKSEYIILSGGSLLLHGLRKSTADIDLCFSKKLAKKVRIETFPKNEKGLYIFSDKCEVSVGLTDTKSEKVDGYRCETLKSILEFKQRKKREKDLDDIKNIKAYLDSSK